MKRRVHLHAQEGQEELFAYWRHFAFLTDREEDMHTVDAEHRQHAEVELAIRDLKDQALAHFPSGRFAANSPWTVIPRPTVWLRILKRKRRETHIAAVLPVVQGRWHS